MAKLAVCAVFDKAVNMYMRPVMGVEGAIRRSFVDEVNRKADDNAMFHHPSDFALYRLGSFDEENGRFELLDQLERLVEASSVVIS